MQKLSLQKQENLTTLALECQCLQEVDLTDCESLTNSICEVFSDGGGCPMLKTLVLDNCKVGKCPLRNHSCLVFSISNFMNFAHAWCTVNKQSCFLMQYYFYYYL